jgi:hypothetical protein
MEDNRAAFLLEFAGRTMYGDEYAQMLAADLCLSPGAVEQLLADRRPLTEGQVETLGKRMRFRAAGLVAIAEELEEVTKHAPPPESPESKVVALRPAPSPNSQRRPVGNSRRAPGRMRLPSLLRRHERTAMRLAVVLLAICSVGTYAALSNVSGRLEVIAATLEVPRVRATVIPGVPAALEATWRQASAPGAADPWSETWLTARIENVGFRAVSHLDVDLSAATGIREIFAVSHVAGASGEPGFAPKVTDGGKGSPAVTISLPKLPPAAEHWLFFGLEAPPVHASAGAAAAPSADPRVFFKTLTVTAKQRSAPERGVTSRVYGWAPAEAAPPPPAQQTKS